MQISNILCVSIPYQAQDLCLLSIKGNIQWLKLLAAEDLLQMVFSVDNPLWPKHISRNIKAANVYQSGAQRVSRLDTVGTNRHLWGNRSGWRFEGKNVFHDRQKAEFLKMAQKRDTFIQFVYYSPKLTKAESQTRQITVTGHDPIGYAAMSGTTHGQVWRYVWHNVAELF